jgi:hypothetical protein
MGSSSHPRRRRGARPASNRSHDRSRSVAVRKEHAHDHHPSRQAVGDLDEATATHVGGDGLLQDRP